MRGADNQNILRNMVKNTTKYGKLVQFTANTANTAKYCKILQNSAKYCNTSQKYYKIL
jgi:hypothetical protein